MEREAGTNQHGDGHTGGGVYCQKFFFYLETERHLPRDDDISHVNVADNA